MLLHVEIEASIMARIRRTSRLDQHSPKVVWHKEVVGLMHVVGVEGTTSVRVMNVSKVASSAFKRVTS